MLAGGYCTILGKGKTAKAVTKWLKDNTLIEKFKYVVEDDFAVEESEKLSIFLNDLSIKNKFIVYGFSDFDKAKYLDDYIFKPSGIKTYFLPFPFSFNETFSFIDKLYYCSHAELFLLTRDMLEERSKALFDEYIYAQISGDLRKLDLYREKTEKQYFKDDCFPKNKSTVFIDVGAYIADTFIYAADALCISKYIALEPDRLNIKKIHSYFNKLNYKNYLVIEKAAWETETSLHIISSGSSSSLSKDSGDYSVSTIKMDSLIPLLNENNCENIFIKMDIEGAELGALRGSQSLIRSFLPYMAICVYHREDDLIAIPQYIESIVPNVYRYNLGYYGNNFRELVLYATPK